LSFRVSEAPEGTLSAKAGAKPGDSTRTASVPSGSPSILKVPSAPVFAATGLPGSGRAPRRCGVSFGSVTARTVAPASGLPSGPVTTPETDAVLGLAAAAGWGAGAGAEVAARVRDGEGEGGERGQAHGKPPMGVESR
jgi:hypothetical protein